MNANEFQSSCHKVISETLNWFHGEFKKGTLKFPFPHTYATQLRIAESPTHFLAELVGAQQVSPDAQITLSTRAIEKLTASNSFFISGKEIGANGTAFITGNGGDLTITGGAYSTNADKSEIESRLGIKLPETGVNCTSADYLIDVENIATCYFVDVNFLYSNGSQVYFRDIVWGIAIKKDLMSPIEFENWLKEKFKSSFEEKRTIGILFNNETPDERATKQLLSLSEQKITERILDKFLQEHKDVFAKALAYQEVYPQCVLKWIERESSDPKESIPDYFMKRADGTFDILDVKKGFLDKKITTGQPARIRFIVYVTELIAQLETYRRYFSSEKNRRYADETYGIKVCSDEIKLLGIVGGYYEHDLAEVEKALAPYKDNITIIGYADLANLIRLSNKK